MVIYKNMKWICDYCCKQRDVNEMVYMSQYYEDSTRVYCQSCWNRREYILLCEKCITNYQAFICTSGGNHMYVCGKCNCEEC
jgi:hypothetical protein